MSAPQAAQAAGQVAQAAAPYWRNAGMSYVAYANACAQHLRNCLKEPHKTAAANREAVHYKFSVWENGVAGKPSIRSTIPEE
ncbi:F-type H+-transporting ATPase subunit epsilon [Marchantia polymorpha subsp. ruderalis]|uniref:ATP synthase subunit epsilon, mitochondrial n=2 Tax=Marchantia polymorpha TaxID=3197 RepID=A0A176VF18_MARPO|nr:hypothetical protein AXG93_461s1130 [Marchantia polymorpha subsp. ruderalis]PTQ50201.1 hypothetical protein MARPO_0001s0230 [Marchantia polymorpha]BBM99124.1 hypothetical protein Mp_1g18920 [Marchantia polymorpha subsp. ruderalis]|eukprot:PTQ50201.1 hypothetical protein MARPO_0001s0230 [Marchantia polymorpha]